MKKTILIVSLAFVLVIGVGALIVWLFGRTAPATTSPSTGSVTLPNAGPSAQQSGTSTDLITINGTAGNSIRTKDFLADPAAGEYPNTGYYYLGYHTATEGTSDPTATSNPPYLIEYIATTQYFTIELLQEPIGSVRAAAEQYLMAHLGITQNQMCRLNYMVSVPDRVNSQLASRNLGFSFCPGATALPK